MFPLFVLGIALLVGMYLLAYSFVHADPRALAKGVRYGAVGLGVATVALLALSGRLGLALTLLAFAAPLLTHWRSLIGRARTAYGPAPSGQTSVVETMYLRMMLHHDSGRMDGEVLRGSWRGRRLGDLALDELVRLMREVKAADSQSATVLEAYLDRTRPEDWRAHMAGAEKQERTGGGTGSAMTLEEAYSILGLHPGAPPEAVKEAHRRLMLKVHPDHGGSTYLAAKINQAKDMLLRSRP